MVSTSILWYSLLLQNIPDSLLIDSIIPEVKEFKGREKRIMAIKIMFNQLTLYQYGLAVTKLCAMMVLQDPLMDLFLLAKCAYKQTTSVTKRQNFDYIRTQAGTVHTDIRSSNRLSSKGGHDMFHTLIRLKTCHMLFIVHVQLVIICTYINASIDCHR